MNNVDELKQQAEDERKQREAAGLGENGSTGKEPETTPPSEEQPAPVETTEEGTQTESEQPAPRKELPRPDFGKMFAGPETGGADTPEELRRQRDEARRELEETKAREKSAAGRLKKRDDDADSELQKLREQNAKLEARLAELDAGDTDDGLDEEVVRGVDRRVQKRIHDAVTPLEEQLRRNNETTRLIEEQRDNERMDALHARLSDEVPDYAEISCSAKWADFMKTIEPLTGKPYGQIAAGAFEARDGARMANVFNKFKEAQGTPVAQNPKVRAQMRPATYHVPPTTQEAARKTFTRAEYDEHYNKVLENPALLGNKDFAARHEEMRRARDEGRIT